MPRYSDAGGGEEFRQSRQSSTMSPRDTARAYFQSGVQGSLLSDMGSAPDSIQSIELTDVTPYEVPLVSSQVIFNRTNTADMVVNPNNYRAYAVNFRDSGLTLAGQYNQVGQLFQPPPPLPIQPYSNAAFPSNTYATYNQGNANIAGAPTILLESRAGNFPYTSYGIGFRMRVNLQYSLPKLWDINIFYYLPTGGAIQTFPVIQNNIALYNSVSVGGESIIQSVQADVNLPFTNIDIYWNLYGAMTNQPAGFDPVPVGTFTFNEAVLAQNPRVEWDCT